MPDPNNSRIDHIIDIARGASPVGPIDRENREATRMPFDGPIELVLISSKGEKSAPITVSGSNISHGGVCVVCKRDLMVGSRGGILIGRSDGEMVVLGVKIIYSNSWAQAFECGLEFEALAPAVSMDDFRDRNGNLPHAQAA